MYTCTEYNLLSRRDEVRSMILYEFDAHGYFRLWINNNFRHGRKFRQIKVCSATDRPEKGFASANSVPIPQIRLHTREAYGLVAVVIYQIVTELLAGHQETFLEWSSIRGSSDIQVPIVSMVSGEKRNKRL